MTLASYLFKPKRQNRQSTVGKYGSCSSKSLHLSGISEKNKQTNNCWYLWKSKAALEYFQKGTCKLHFKLFKDSEWMLVCFNFQKFAYKLPAPPEMLLKQDFIIACALLCRIFFFVIGGTMQGCMGESHETCPERLTPSFLTKNRIYIFLRK